MDLANSVSDVLLFFFIEIYIYVESLTLLRWSLLILSPVSVCDTEGPVNNSKARGGKNNNTRLAFDK